MAKKVIKMVKLQVQLQVKQIRLHRSVQHWVKQV